MPDVKAKAKKPAAAKAAKAAQPVAEGGKKCCVEKCKQPVRAKGYCRKHYMAWKREQVGKKFRYKICSKEGCRKKSLLGGCCAEHKKGAEAAAPTT